jgi:hypothetical protein
MGYLMRFFLLLARLARALLSPNREGYLKVNEQGAHWVKADGAAGAPVDSPAKPAQLAPAAPVPEPSPSLDFSKLEHASPEERKAAIEFLAQTAVDRLGGSDEANSPQ